VTCRKKHIEWNGQDKNPDNLGEIQMIASETTHSKIFDTTGNIEIGFVAVFPISRKVYVKNVLVS